MKSFQSFLTEASSSDPKARRIAQAYGTPSGAELRTGEPMYTKRPGPNEPGRRATVQQSPKTVSQVKGEIQAAKGFSGVRKGGLETRPVPQQVTQHRQARAQRILGKDPWSIPTSGGGQTTFERNLRRAMGRVATPGHRERAFRDFLRQAPEAYKTNPAEIFRQALASPETIEKFKSSTPEDPWKGIKSTVPPKPNPTEPFGDTGFDPHGTQKGSPKPQSTSRPPKAPEPPKTPEPPKAPEPPKTTVVKPQLSDFDPPKELKLGTEPGGQLEIPGLQSKPDKGVTAGLGPRNPLDYKVVDVEVKDITPNKEIVKQTSKYINNPSAAARPQRPFRMDSILRTYGPRGTVASTRPASSAPSNAAEIARLRQAMGARTAQQTTQQTIQQTAQQTAQQVRQQQRQTTRAMSRLTTQRAGAATRLLGRGLGVAGVGYDVYSGAKGEQQRGSGLKRSLAKGAAQAIGGAIGGAVGGAVLPVVGTIGGATAGSAAAGKLFDVAAGENAKERAARQLQTRKSQAGDYFIGKDNTTVTQKGKTGFVSTGTGSDRKTAQLASTKVVTDPLTGKQNVGYLAFKTDPAGKKQAVYKTGETDPAKSTSNPLERIGRTYFKDLYRASDLTQKELQLNKAREQQQNMRTKLGMS